jgi:uncharacterized paraquat-inducible protein A
MQKRALPFMLERIRRCRRCHLEVNRPPLEYEEMPYCASCLSKEVKKGARAGVRWRRTGNYVEIRQGAQKAR